MREAMPATGPFGRPAGILGRLAAWMMAGSNAPVYGMAVELLDIQPSDHVLEPKGSAADRSAAHFSENICCSK